MFNWDNSAKRYWLNHDIRKSLLLAISIVMASLLIWLGATTLFNTISGDDMVFERTLSSTSTLISQPLGNYVAWTARLTNIFSLNLLFSLLPEQSLIHLTLLFSLAITLLSAWYLMTSVFRYTGTSYPRLLGFALSAAFSLSLCVFSSTTYDNFYWMAGVVTYIVPLALFGAIGGRLIRKKKLSKLSLVTLGILSLIMGLYNEAFVLQGLAVISVLFGLTVIKLGPRRTFRQVAIRYAPLFIGLLLAGIIMKLAPGTDYRMHLNQSLAPSDFDHSFIGLLKMSVHTTSHELYTFVSHNWGGLSLLISIVLVGALPSKPSEWLRKNATYVFGACALVPPLAFFTLAFGVHYAYQPAITEYSLITANYLAYLAIAVAALCAAQYIPRSKPFVVGSVIGAIVVSVIATLIMAGRIEQINQLIRLQQKEFNATNSAIISAKQSGKNEIHIGISKLYFSYCVPEVSPTTWCNEAYGQYYGVQSITASQYIDYSNSYQQVEGAK